MWPTLFTLHFFGVERIVTSYGAMLSLAMLVGGALAVRAAHREGMDVGLVFVALAMTVLSAFVGGYVLFVVVEYVRTGDLLHSVTAFGRVLYGSYVGGLVGFLWIAKKLELPRMSLLDLAVPAIASAHAIGRIGCLLGGCCYGSAAHTPWSVTASDALAPAAHPSIARHPTALYEALLVIIIAVAVTKMPKKRYDGERFVLFVAFYAIARFFLEFVRGDAERGVVFGLFGTSQLIAVVLCALAFILHSKWAHASASRHDALLTPPAGPG